MGTAWSSPIPIPSLNAGAITGIGSDDVHQFGHYCKFSVQGPKTSVRGTAALTAAGFGTFSDVVVIAAE